MILRKSKKKHLAGKKRHTVGLFLVLGLFFYDSSCSQRNPSTDWNDYPKSNHEGNPPPHENEPPPSSKDPIPLPVYDNTLWCRYRTEYGRLNEKAGLNEFGQVLTFPMYPNGNEYFWECPDQDDKDKKKSAHKCPRYTNSDITIYSDLFFILNEIDIPKGSQIPSDNETFERIALKSCNNYTPHEGSTFVEYGIRSPNDFQSTLFHKPFFSNSQDIPNTSLPFSRIVLFGDSISDNGNFWDTAGHLILQWPYFMGRFSNGPVWVEQLVEQMNKQQNFQPKIDLYNYAVGGSASASEGYNFGYSNLDIQVQRYLEAMKNAPKAKADWNSDYDKTLFVFFIGTNDYFVFADLFANSNWQELAKFCGLQLDTDIETFTDLCAKSVVFGLNFRKASSDGIKNNIQYIIEQAQETNPGKDLYFLIPNEPDMSLLAYYNLYKFPPPPSSLVISREFVRQASLSHNKYLEQAISELQEEFADVLPKEKLHFLKLNMFDIFKGLINEDNKIYADIIKDSGITNKTEACFNGAALDLTPSLNFCFNPKSYMFWDPVHPSMTMHCNIAELALEEIYKAFGKQQVYVPDFKKCHNSYIEHPLNPYQPF